MSAKRILVISSSREGNSGYLETAVPLIKSFLGEKPLNIAFIPFASVKKNYAEYLVMVQNALASTPYTVELLTETNAKALIEKADVIMTGGGNTFKLLRDLYHYKLMDPLRDKINNGSPYIGWSAGANITCPTIGTTNDMPVIEPKSHKALAFFSFQINPHYYNTPIKGFNGETRDQRLFEFALMNPGIPIIGLPEGSALQLENRELKFIAKNPAVLYYFENTDAASRKIIQPGEDLTYLL